ncbi:TetR/AcrR family transcriptional regulator [Paracidovorax avenae]|uniref:TetR/AcrR family transcriptional regulator n=1 Tax=Paracidovorax avenae TaxID=80867 RepID=UPI001CEF6C62|nr:TetR/AcrR family transcriptional regulator [Paracidovorax avenae]
MPAREADQQARQRQPGARVGREQQPQPVERAVGESLTPPALYRYFPNKYALLSELGQGLMQRQNECVGRWIGAEVFSHGEQALASALEGLRAVPALQQVRLAFHAEVTQAQTQLLARVLPGTDPGELRLASRVVVEMIYAAVEMLFDEALDRKAVARTVAAMLASQLGRTAPPTGLPAAPAPRPAGRRAR